jgi:cytochrome c oxidase cbb3-type subunit I/II
MPKYAHLLTNALDYDGLQRRVDAMVMLGVPYGEAVRAGAASRLAREQAETMARGIEAQGGPANLADKEIIALTAYLQRLGKDIRGAATPIAAGGTQ